MGAMSWVRRVKDVYESEAAAAGAAFALQFARRESESSEIRSALRKADLFAQHTAIVGKLQDVLMSVPRKSGFGMVVRSVPGMQLLQSIMNCGVDVACDSV